MIAVALWGSKKIRVYLKMNSDNMDQLLGSLDTLASSAAEFHATSSNFVSSLKFLGRPALPPVVSNVVCKRGELLVLNFLSILNVCLY